MPQKLAVAAILFAALLSGCASSRENIVAQTPTPLTPHEAAQQVVAIAAGYCKGMVEKQGADFETCFTQKTDEAMARIQANQATAPAKAEHANSL